MPVKTKKGKGKGKGGKKKGADSGLSVDPVKLMKQVLAEYEAKCAELLSTACPSVRLSMRECIEQEQLLTKFIVCPRDRREYVQWADADLLAMFGPPPESPPKTPTKKKKGGGGGSRSRSQSKRRGQKKGEPASGQALIDRFLKQEPPSDKPLVRVRPLMEALRSKRFTYITALYVWDMLLDLVEMTAISSLIGKGFYALTKVELMDCLVPSYSLKAFGEATRACKTLTEVVLDYNDFADDGCKDLCCGLIGNRHLKTLSLCYCRLSYVSGKYLGDMLCQSAVVDLFLDGNDLEAEGVIYLVDSVADCAEEEARQREEAEKRKLEEAAEKAMQAAAEGGSQPSSGKKKGKKGGKKKGKKGGKKKGKKGKRRAKSARPPIEPVIRKLHLADNGIDQTGRGANFVCLKSIIRLGSIVSCSQTLEELDIWGNDIGDVGGRLVLEFLQARKQAKLPGLSFRVGPRMNSETFDNIRKLGSGLKKKKRGRKGKKKRK